MKSLFGIIGLAAILLACSVNHSTAQVPIYAAQTLWSTNGATTNSLAAATAIATTAVVDCRKQSQFALQVTAQCDTGGGAVGLLFMPSVDGVSYPASAVASGQYVTLTPTATGVTLVTNLSSYWCGYWKLAYVTNTTGAAVTNITVKYGVKISAP